MYSSQKGVPAMIQEVYPVRKNYAVHQRKFVLEQENLCSKKKRRRTQSAREHALN